MNAVAKNGHPKGLMTLFFSEMWERFCYYGMRALLTIFLIDVLLKGDSEAAIIYGTYTALVYMSPVLGGMLADKLLGYKNAVIIGGILMAIGEFLLLGATDFWVFLGMSAIIVGNGYFKANISSIVGKLYEDGDPKRDSGFTIFYIGINIGALLATTVCAEVGIKVGYAYGFGLAGIGMIIGVIIFALGAKHYSHAAEPPNPERLYAKDFGPFNRFHLVLLGSVILIPVIYFLITYNEIMNVLLPVVGIYVIYNLLNEGVKEGKIWRDRMIIMIILFVFNIVFWSFFEQAGTSLTLFARRNVDRDIFGLFEMGEATTQFFNPAFIILFGSIFSLMWVKLDKIGKNPNIPTKFGLGIIQLGLGFLIIRLGGMFLSDAYLVPIWTLALLYMLHTTGELFLSPIGLSMVTKLAPKHMTGAAMGGWFLSFSASNYVAGLLAAATGFGGHGGGTTEKADLDYNQRIEIVEFGTQKLKTASTQLSETLIKLESSEDKEIAKLAYEIKKMNQAIVPTIEQINDELLPYFKDNNKYTGTKTILWKDLAPKYQKSIQTLDESIKSVKTSSLNLLEGKSYESEIEQIGSGIISIGSAMDLLTGDKHIYGTITRNNEGFELSKTKNASESFGKEYKTISAHMTWDVYNSFFNMMAMIAIGMGLLLVLINKPLNKLMHGVK